MEVKDEAQAQYTICSLAGVCAGTSALQYPYTGQLSSMSFFEESG